MQFTASTLRPVENAASIAAPVNPKLIKTWQTKEYDEEGKLIEHCIHYVEQNRYWCDYLVQAGEVEGEAQTPEIKIPKLFIETKSFSSMDEKRKAVLSLADKGLNKYEIHKQTRVTYNLQEKFINERNGTKSN